jgi:glycosyltransferase involved in cell wall biosynthesis
VAAGALDAARGRPDRWNERSFGGRSGGRALKRRILLCTFYFPPAGGGGVQRPLKLAQQLPAYGFETHVLAPDDPRWIHRDDAEVGVPKALVHRVRFLGPRGRRPAEELYGLEGLELLARRAALLPRRLLVPDEDVPWLLTAAPALLAIVREQGIDTVVTTSPPNSVHLLGPLVKRLRDVRWVADVRDSIVASHERRVQRLVVRAKEQSQRVVARAIARHADAVVAVTEQIAREIRSFGTAAPVTVIPNGADFDDSADLEYRRGERFRITHTGSFFGWRDPRPFLRALAGTDDDDVVARFVGDFRAADLEWAHGLDLGDRLQLEPFAPRRRSLELQRDSEALLLLLPDVGERGRDVPSGKLFEYFAARRPILAAVPPDGTAAGLVREAGAGIVVAPDDVEGLRASIDRLVQRWRANELADVSLPPGFEARVGRPARIREFAELLERLN